MPEFVLREFYHFSIIFEIMKCSSYLIGIYLVVPSLCFPPFTSECRMIICGQSLYALCMHWLMRLKRSNPFKFLNLDQRQIIRNLWVDQQKPFYWLRANFVRIFSESKDIRALHPAHIFKLFHAKLFCNELASLPKKL